MKEPAAKKTLCCAIYTRKSTEHNLDLEFNSLDAQREACEAYIKSQMHEGWRPVLKRYDDGAFSGASLDRPALRTLLSDVKAGRIDVIVVYKVDRLTRSLADFAKLVELFDQHSVSFISVTQSFNTTSSMGRLTLNVLLSFAQFEREVIGERVRDKIAASKAKGLWVGGPIPLGYASVDKKLMVVPEEAEQVRLIFRRYLELGSIGSLMQDLDRRGIRTRQQQISGDRIRGGIRFGLGSLQYLLRNRFYIGEVVYRGKVHRGEHEPILDQALFEAVQAKLADGRAERRLRLKATPAILVGRLFDDHGNRMTPTHTNKSGARYRYYVSHAILQKRCDDAGTIARVSAPDIEELVTSALRKHLVQAGDAQTEAHDLVERHVDRIIIRAEAIEIYLQDIANADKQLNGGQTDKVEATNSDCPPAFIAVPWSGKGAAATKGILHSPTLNQPMDSKDRDALLTAIARARAWIEDLLRGRAGSFADIAARESKVERHIRFLAPLAFVSPRIISVIIDGTAPLDLTVTQLAKSLSYSWAEQERRLGLPQG